MSKVEGESVDPPPSSVGATIFSSRLLGINEHLIAVRSCKQTKYSVY